MNYSGKKSELLLLPAYFSIHGFRDYVQRNFSMHEKTFASRFISLRRKRTEEGKMWKRETSSWKGGEKCILGIWRKLVENCLYFGMAAAAAAVGGKQHVCK